MWPFLGGRVEVNWPCIILVKKYHECMYSAPFLNPALDSSEVLDAPAVLSTERARGIRRIKRVG
jgi:hypothetical protein